MNGPRSENELSHPKLLGPILCASLLALAACGNDGEPERDPDATFGVEPGTAMDTTPAGTPAPPEEPAVEAAEEGIR